MASDVRINNAHMNFPYLSNSLVSLRSTKKHFESKQKFLHIISSVPEHWKSKVHRSLSSAHSVLSEKHDTGKQAKLSVI